MKSFKYALEVPVVIYYDEDGVDCVELDFDSLKQDITGLQGGGFNTTEQAKSALEYELQRQADMHEAMLEDAAEARMEARREKSYSKHWVDIK